MTRQARVRAKTDLSLEQRFGTLVVFFAPLFRSLLGQGAE